MTISLIFASDRVLPGLVLIVTDLSARLTFTDSTSGCLRNVFSIPVAQNAQTIPLTVVLIVSPETAAERIRVVIRVSRYFFKISSSELNLPVSHDVLVAAVTDLEEIGLVEKTQQRRGHEMIVLRRMMIHLEHDPGV